MRGRLARSCLQRGQQRADVDPFCAQRDKDVIDQVGGLLHRSLGVMRRQRRHELRGFLTQLLQTEVLVVQKLDGVAAVGALRGS